jgi:hypothetical protein
LEKKAVVRVNLKLAPGADAAILRKMLPEIRGVLHVIQTFPGETDQELAGLYLVEVDGSHLRSALRDLKAIPGVEYAEEAAPRKLIRRVALEVD